MSRCGKAILRENKLVLSAGAAQNNLSHHNTLGLKVVKPNKGLKTLGYPAGSPFRSTFLKRHLLLPRGDAARTSRETARAQWLPNLHNVVFWV